MISEYLWAKLIKKLRGTAIRNSQIDALAKVESGSHVINSSLGKHSFCGYDCEIINCDIGSFCSIANNVKIGGGMHPIDWVSTSPVFYEGRDSVKTKFSTHKRPIPRRTTIGHDVWIGQGAILKQGIHIGTGAVIGMGSVVTKDVEPYMIVGGNPARVIKPRFDTEIAGKLMEIKWWEFSDAELTFFGKFFTEPRLFMARFEK